MAMLRSPRSRTPRAGAASRKPLRGSPRPGARACANPGRFRWQTLRRGARAPWAEALRTAARRAASRPSGRGLVGHISSVGSFLDHGEAEPLARIVITLRDRLGERANAADVARAFRDRDRAARIEEVERVRGLQHLLICRQRELALHQALRTGLEIGEVAKERFRVDVLEVVGRLLDLVL